MTRALGVDIGTTHVRFLILNITSRTRDIMLLEEHPFDGTNDSLKSILTTFAQNHNLEDTRISVNLGHTAVLIKNLSFPFNDKRKLQSAIRAEFEDTLPFSIDEHIIEFQYNEKKGRLFDYTCALVSGSVIQNLQSLCESCGLEISSIHYEAEALAQLALNQALPAAQLDEPWALLHIGPRHSYFCIQIGARPKQWNSKASPPKIDGEVLEMRHFSVDLSGLDNGVPLEEVLQPLITDLQNSIQAFNLRFQGSQPTAIYLSGDYAEFDNLKAHIEHSTYITTHPWPLSVGFEPGATTLAPQQEARFALALALAHRWSIQKPKGWLNFRRSSQASRKILSRFIEDASSASYRSVILASFAIIAASWVYGLVSQSTYSSKNEALTKSLSSEFNFLDEKIGKSAKTFAEDIKLGTEYFEKVKKKKNLELAKLLKSQGTGKSEILLDFSENLPRELSLHTIKIQGSKIQAIASGIAAEKSLEELQDKLNLHMTARGYKNIKVGKTSSNGQFPITAQWEGVGAKAR